jgi:phosphate transport system substrate-binding protein
MPVREGYCQNTTLPCSKAGDKVEVTGQDPRCQECGQKLRVIGEPQPPPPPPVLLRLLLLAALLVATVPLIMWALHPRTLFRIHGSTTIGDVLMPRLADEYFKYKKASGIRIQVDGKRTEVSGRLPGELRRRVIELVANETGGGFEDYRKGACDAVMASRDIVASDVKTPQVFDQLSHDGDNVIGLDGVAIIVNEQMASTLKSITLSQLADIFSGSVTDWQGIPGAGTGGITVISRAEKSGTWKTFEDKVLKPFGKKLKDPDNNRFDRNQDLVDKVAGTRGAIGFASMTFAQGVRTLAVAGQAGMTPLPPTRQTVRLEFYPISRRLHIYLPDGAPAGIGDFVKFVLSDAGQQLVAEGGFTDQRHLATEEQVLPPPPGNPGARPLETLFFHFGTGQAKLDYVLDLKALRNLESIVEEVMKPENGNRELLLYGHSDSAPWTGSDPAGSRAMNQKLSIDRARGVADSLKELARRRGKPDLKPIVKGYGQDKPIAPNDDIEDHRKQNRCVEVWLSAPR